MMINYVHNYGRKDNKANSLIKRSFKTRETSRRCSRVIIQSDEKETQTDPSDARCEMFIHSFSDCINAFMLRLDWLKRSSDEFVMVCINKWIWFEFGCQLTVELLAGIRVDSVSAISYLHLTYIWRWSVSEWICYGSWESSLDSVLNLTE